MNGQSDTKQVITCTPEKDLQSQLPALLTGVSADVDLLVQKAFVAGRKFKQLNQEQVDKIVKAMTLAGLGSHMELARLAIDETRRGIYEDKISKNIFATEFIYHSIKYKKTVGIINRNEEEDIYEIAEPLGVVAAIIPVTNPTSTTMFKSLLCAKTRNPVVFSFHPASQRCSVAAAKCIYQAGIAAGAPENYITWIEKPSLEATNALMNHAGIALILATGGHKMVNAAYSAGKPALGVGPGNVPAFIERSAKLKRAISDIILSKTYDNGMICASEQAVIVEEEIADQVVALFKENNCYFLNESETAKLTDTIIDKGSGTVISKIVGQSADFIAALAGITVPEKTKILMASLAGVGRDFPLSQEKLSPILAFYVVDDYRQGIKRCEEMIEFGGQGHSAAIHSEDKQIIAEFSSAVHVGRIIVNSPCTQGAIGDIYNANVASLTLGCGSYGRNSTTANVSVDSLINIKRVAGRKDKLQWFKVPPRIYFMPGAVQYLTKMPLVERVFIVTDEVMVKLGYVDKVLYHLNKRQNNISVEVFDQVTPDPTTNIVTAGVAVMKQFRPDTIIALGGGSPIDAAKAMWLFYEHPDVEFEFLKLKFMDIRKRTYKYPKLGRKIKMVAIPTTSGTGSEVSAFTIITDQGDEVKYPLADYELTPDVAIIDPDFVLSIPKEVTADSGVDVLTHAIEAYTSVMASDYTDALAIKAIELVFAYLPRSYELGDKNARERMHNASTIAGMAFTNAFLGINHSLAHKLGGQFHIAHGRANAVLLPHVIAYNAQVPTKFAAFPNYEHYVADLKYQQIARHLGLPASTPEEGVRSLIDSIYNLMRKLNMPLTIAECGVDADEFASLVDEMAEKAFEDQCTTANPRMPLITELIDIYKRAYDQIALY